MTSGDQPRSDGELGSRTRNEYELSLLDRGVAAADVSIMATLASGGVPASVLFADALAKANLDDEQVAERLAHELKLEMLGAVVRIKRYLKNVREARAYQAARFTQRATDALADVLGASREAFRQSFRADATLLNGALAAPSLAREGRSDVNLDQSLTDEDNDDLDELFNRSYAEE